MQRRARRRELGRFVREVHEHHGVQFHLGQTVASIAEQSITLEERDEARGRPGGRRDRCPARIWNWLSKRGWRSTGGVLVDEYLRTSVPRFGPPATSHAGRTATPAHPYESSTGSWPSSMVKPPHKTSLGHNQPYAYRSLFLECPLRRDDRLRGLCARMGRRQKVEEVSRIAIA
jgi:hypothetical protein